jgi:allophanate hydrolase subunit 1
METLVINTETNNITKIIDFLNSIQVSFVIKREEKQYNKEFVERILKSREQHKQGEGRIVKIDDLWK